MKLSEQTHFLRKFQLILQSYGLFDPLSAHNYWELPQI